ncbi:MAG: TonB-dependent receptor, partial [Rikenellaceae bacterium]|nr:TonB-dependent receptor [Rikenellaceae bacterium]
DFMRDYLMSYQFSTAGANKQYTADIFAQFDWNISERFNLLAGLRFDYFSKSKANNLSPKVAAMYRFNRLTLRGSYAAGFRAPTLKELYMDFDMANIFTIYGNPELKSELSHNFLLSAEYNKNRYNLMVSGFYNIVNDRITTVWSQTLKGMLYANMERVNVAGAEVNLSAKWGCCISARLSYAYTHEMTDGDKALISNTRPHSATLRVAYNKFISNDYSFNVTLHGRYLSRVVANEYIFTSIDQAVKRTYPEYTMWKLALNNRILNGINLTLSIDNLLDYVPDYYYNNSPTTVGRTYSVGVSVDIERLLKR